MAGNSRTNDDNLSSKGAKGVKGQSPKPDAPSLSYPTNPGEALIVYRERYGLRQPAVAQALGVTASYISNLERGEREPSAELAKKIWELLATNPTNDANEQRAKRAKVGKSSQPSAVSDRPKRPKKKTPAGTPKSHQEAEKSCRPLALGDQLRLKRMARYSNWLLGFSNWAMEVLRAPKTQSKLFQQADELAFRMLFRVLEIRKQALPILERAEHSSEKVELEYDLRGRLVTLAINLLGCPNLSERLTALANEFMNEIFREQNTALNEGIDLHD